MRRLFATVVVALSAASPTPSAAPVQNISRASTLPDNPCDVLTQDELSRITQLNILSVERVPDIREVVQAEREHREPRPGIICSYGTRTPFNAITIDVPPRPLRTTDRYWAQRTDYFQTYRGSAEPIRGLGQDAWLAARADLRVLIRDGEYFHVATQSYQPQSRELLIRIARAILEKF